MVIYNSANTLWMTQNSACAYTGLLATLKLSTAPWNTVFPCLWFQFYHVAHTKCTISPKHYPAPNLHHDCTQENTACKLANLFNLTGFRNTIETHLWVCPWGTLHPTFIKEGKPARCVDALLHGKVPHRIKKRRQVAHKQSRCCFLTEGTVVSRLLLLTPHLPPTVDCVSGK